MKNRKFGVGLLAAGILLQASTTAFSGSVSGSKTGNVTIPDAGGYVSSTIVISGAPSGAVVTGIDVYLKCVHPYGSDLTVDLNADSTGSLGNYRLWNRETGVNPTRTTTGISTYNGLSVNRTWYLYAKDWVAQDSGYIDEWTITVYYADAAPTISSVSPNPLTGANTASTLTVSGSGFVSGATVRLRCSAFGVDTTKSATFINSGQLQVSATVGTDPSSWTAQVINPSSATSSQFGFSVQAPVPVITSLSPNSASAGGAAFTLRVNGDTFHQASVVRWNGSNRTTTPVVSGGGLTTALDAQISAADIATAGSATVTVYSSGPGGGTSSGATFAINSVNPTISSVSPNPLTGANTASTLTVNGSGFVSGATVRLRCATFGVDTTKSATFINSGQLQVSATFGTDPSSWTAQVINPSTAASGQFNFSVQAPTPVITSLSPSTASAGGAAFTLRVNGDTFHQASVVRWNGADRTTTPVVSGGGLTTALDAQISVADIASAGAATVTVYSPGPGGGTSAGATFTINTVNPTVSSVSPNPVTGANSASVLTVNGSGFVNGATVRLRCSAFGVDTTKSATFINSGQLQVSATFGTDPSSWTAQVINPSTAVSSEFGFSVQAPVPVITSLSPNSASAGSAAFTLRVNGDTFHQASVVRWNGADRATTPVVSGGGLTTALDAQITAADVASAGTATVTVTSPGPGGGTSSGATFTINTSGPSISSVSPNPLTGANSASALSVNGSGFVNGATVRLRCPAFGVDSTRPATFINSGQLQVSATFGTDPSSWTAQVINPSTAASSEFGFSVQAPVPVITSLSPISALAGGPVFTLRVNGSTFHQASIVRWNGANRTTTPVVSGGGLTTALSAQIPASDIALSGTAAVSVNSPGPGGGTSVGATFAISPAPATPALSVAPITPPSQPAAAGSISFAVNNAGGGTMSYSASVTGGTSWLRITSGATGGNSGTIVAAYDANVGAQRSGTIVVTASGASSSPAALTVFQSAPSGTTVMLPGAISYIRQIHDSDMHTGFNSANSCGPCSAVMILTYYNRLTAHPMIGQSGQNNDFSWYVAPIGLDSLPSATAYSYGGFTFSVGTHDVKESLGGIVNFGAHGYLCQDSQDDPQTFNERALEYLWKHGLWAYLDYFPTVEQVRSEIDAGRPVFLSTKYSATGNHIMVVRGYEPSILNPGTGTEASHLASRVIAADPWLRASGEDRHAVSYSWDELHYGGAQKYMIRSLSPISAGARVRATAAFPGNVREQPTTSANPAGATRTAGELGAIVLDTAKNSTFWNADGYTWIKVRWDGDQVVGWSAVGSSPYLWIEPYASSGGASGGGVSSPAISAAKLTGGNFTLSVPAQVGFECVLECKDVVSGGGWASVQTNSGSAGFIGLTNSGAVGPGRIYRVRMQ